MQSFTGKTTRWHFSFFCCFSFLAVFFFIHSPAQSAEPVDVNRSLEKGKEWIYSQQGSDGTWETSPKRQSKAEHDKSGAKLPYGHVTQGGQWGGRTALAVYALLAAGESHQSPRLTRAIDFLKKAELVGTYALGIRCLVMAQLPQTGDVQSVLKKDAMQLIQSVKLKGDARGFYDYISDGTPDETSAHSLSRSQYALLGIWTAEQLGAVEVSTNFWNLVETAWIHAQRPDGSWPYSVGGGAGTWGQPSPGRTAAGVATMYITQDYLQGNSGINCAGSLPTHAAIVKGTQWIEQNWARIDDSALNGKPIFPIFALYSVERIGVASGLKRFASVDWFDFGQALLIKKQTSKGNWTDSYGEFSATCFAVLFISRGRAPIAINKLEYEIPTGPENKPSPGDWNQRPRDVANCVRWLGRNSERLLNWQSVSLKRPEDLYDAPILYISGKQALGFSEAEQALLRTFVQDGGLILGNADCANQAFAKSFIALGSALFPKYEFRVLPEDHVINRSQQFDARKFRSPIRAQALSNGIRELMVLVPDADLAKTWQANSSSKGGSEFQFAANLYFYLLDKQRQRPRGETERSLVDSKTTGTPKKINLARLEYDGNWNPEPGGWRRLTQLLQKQKLATLVSTEMKLTGEPIPAEISVAHLTGTTTFRLSPEQRSTLQKFAARGGFLIVDAAGGRSEFAASAEKELIETFSVPATALQSPLAPAHRIFSGRDPLDISFRSFAMQSGLSKGKAPRLRGIEVQNRLAVVYSSEDLSAGLVGQEVDGINGYTPVCATDLMTRILLNIPQ